VDMCDVWTGRESMNTVCIFSSELPIYR